MPKSALRTSLHALAVSLTDSVMAAIRDASLEDLMREAPELGRRTDTRRGAKAEGAPASAVDLRGHPGGQTPPRVPASPRRSRSSASADPVLTPIPPAPAAEITDPQGLLAMGTREPLRVVPSEISREPVPDGPASTIRAVEAGSPVRLRANETLARVSNAGVVIRRVK